MVSLSRSLSLALHLSLVVAVQCARSLSTTLSLVLAAWLPIYRPRPISLLLSLSLGVFSPPPRDGNVASPSIVLTVWPLLALYSPPCLSRVLVGWLRRLTRSLSRPPSLHFSLSLCLLWRSGGLLFLLIFSLALIFLNSFSLCHPDNAERERERRERER